jgi:hypothetical protein
VRSSTWNEGNNGCRGVGRKEKMKLKETIKRDGTRKEIMTERKE